MDVSLDELRKLYHVVSVVDFGLHSCKSFKSDVPCNLGDKRNPMAIDISNSETMEYSEGRKSVIKVVVDMALKDIHLQKEQ